MYIPRPCKYRQIPSNLMPPKQWQKYKKHGYIWFLTVKHFFYGYKRRVLVQLHSPGWELGRVTSPCGRWGRDVPNTGRNGKKVRPFGKGELGTFGVGFWFGIWKCWRNKQNPMVGCQFPLKKVYHAISIFWQAHKHHKLDWFGLYIQFHPCSSVNIAFTIVAGGVLKRTPNLWNVARCCWYLLIFNDK